MLHAPLIESLPRTVEASRFQPSDRNNVGHDGWTNQDRIGRRVFTGHDILYRMKRSNLFFRHRLFGVPQNRRLGVAKSSFFRMPGFHTPACCRG
jgi:hypothetical protein